jgi:hypothetical protein
VALNSNLSQANIATAPNAAKRFKKNTNGSLPSSTETKVVKIARRDDLENLVVLCETHHIGSGTGFHSLGAEEFERRYGVQFKPKP